MKSSWKIEIQLESGKGFYEALRSNQEIAHQELDVEEIWDVLLQTMGIKTQDHTDEEIYNAVLSFFYYNPEYSVRACSQGDVSFKIRLERKKGVPHFLLDCPYNEKPEKVKHRNISIMNGKSGMRFG